MSAVQIQSSGSGAGTLSIAAPITATNRTLTLPDATTTFVGTDATQTLTNKTIQGGAITSGTAVASTSGTAINFTSIPSWVKRITVMFQGVSTSGTSYYRLQLGTGGTPETTGYSSVGSNVSTAGGALTISSTSGFDLYINTASYVSSGAIRFTNISGNTWVAEGTLGNITTTVVIFNVAGAKTLAGVLNMVRITTLNGTDTFDAGSINILYEG